MKNSHAKRDLAFLAAVLLAVTVYYLFSAQGSPAVSFSAESKAVGFTGAKNTAVVFDLNTVTDIRLVDTPADATAVDGGELPLGGVCWGTWRSDSLGAYQAYFSTRIGVCVLVTDGEKTALFNTENAELTGNFCEQLRSFWLETQSTDKEGNPS